MADVTPNLHLPYPESTDAADIETAVKPLAMALDAMRDLAVGSPSFRTLGPGAAQAMPGNALPTPGDGTVTVAKTAPGAQGLAKGSFSVYRAAAQNIMGAGGAVVFFDVEEWDVSGYYNPVNGRFTPGVAGYYRLSALAYSVGGAAVTTVLRKNGAEFKYLMDDESGDVRIPGSILVQANGTTDYFDVLTRHNNIGVAQSLNVGQKQCYFQGELVGRS